MHSSGDITPQPTLAQIAAAAGTSVPTVSKVLNGGTDVSQATRRRVFATAESLGYRPRPRRRAAVGDRREVRRVDVIVNHLEGSWITRVLGGIEDEAAAAGVDLVLTVARSEVDWLPRVLRHSSVGTILVLVDVAESQLEAMAAAGIPAVSIDPASRPPAGVASIGATNWDGGRMAAEHLLQQGHDRIGVIGGSRRHLYSTARIDGFTSTLRAGGVTVPHQWVVHCDWRRELARSAAQGMMRLGSGGPTAIFGCSDLMALGVYDAARDENLRIPDDVSVVGFDDVHEAAWAMPPMTTVHQPVREMGAAAFRLLEQKLRATAPAGVAATRLELETRLTIRASTAAPSRPGGPQR